MLTIAFLQNNHNHPGYTGASLRAGGIGGTEGSVIQLAEALASLGHRVFALNRIDCRATEAGVNWVPLQDKQSLPAIDVAIGINSPRVLDGVKARRTIVWLHNPPTLRQQLKHRNFMAVLRHRPHAVLLSEYQSGLLHRRLPYSGRSIVHYGISGAFLSGEPDRVPRAPRAIFTSQPQRGLAFVSECWAAISEAMPSAELHVFYPLAKHEEVARLCANRTGIIVRGSVSRSQLAQELRASRVMLVPGVTDETYCLAAAEATASGVPIVTLGIGALSERVRHNETGFIVSTGTEFTERAIRLLSDEGLWKSMHEACLGDGSLAPWQQRAEEWDALFGKLLARR
jgi:glycosyltransferase involved in cell wall biosynthesis